jgi:hypothetical protein
MLLACEATRTTMKATNAGVLWPNVSCMRRQPGHILDASVCKLHTTLGPRHHGFYLPFSHRQICKGCEGCKPSFDPMGRLECPAPKNFFIECYIAFQNQQLHYVSHQQQHYVPPAHTVLTWMIGHPARSAMLSFHYRRAPSVPTPRPAAMSR